MPQDKNTRARHKFLDECFRRKTLTIEELLEKLNYHLDDHCLRPISIRTLRNDINIFESEYGAEFNPNLWEGKKKIYHYADENFSINKFNELSDNDKRLLSSAARLLSEVDGLPFDETFAKVRMDIRNIVDSDSDEEQIVYYDTINELKGLADWWQKCYDTISERKAVRLKYKDFKNHDFEFTVSPYALKEFNNRWYLIGTNHESPDHYYNFPLDRITDIQTADDIAYIPNNDSVKDYYDDVYGITNVKDEPVEDVRFVVSGPTAKYFHTKPIYPYCKMKWLDDNSLEVRMSVKLNYELEHRLLAMADAITILEPQRLVDRHIQMLRDAAAKYM